MSDNKRNIDTDDIAKPSQGDSSPTGTGTHARHTVEAEREQSDNKAKGLAGRKAGEEKKAE